MPESSYGRAYCGTCGTRMRLIAWGATVDVWFCGRCKKERSRKPKDEALAT